jgi:hypothetical protein
LPIGAAKQMADIGARRPAANPACLGCQRDIIRTNFCIAI